MGTIHRASRYIGAATARMPVSASVSSQPSQATARSVTVVQPLFSSSAIAFCVEARLALSCAAWPPACSVRPEVTNTDFSSRMPVW